MSILKQGRLFISRSFDTKNGEGCSVFVSEVIKESNRKKRHRDKRGVHFVEAIIEKKRAKKIVSLFGVRAQ